MARMCFCLVFAFLVALHMGSNPVEASAVDGDVVFDSSDLEEEFEMPISCQGQSYCFEKGANYPEETIDELLADMHELKVENPEPRTNIDSRNGDTYDESEAPSSSTKVENPEPRTNIDSRSGDTYDEPDCPSNSTHNPIFYIVDKNGKVRVVVQSPEKFQQIYSVKWCRHEGLITRNTPHFLQRSYVMKKFKMECVSTKMDFDFFVLSDKVDPVSLKPKMEIASAMGGIPVCCRCQYNVDN